MDIWMDVDAALSEVPVNLMPLLDDTDQKSKEESIAYNESGMDLVWNFVTCAGAFTQTAVTPTTGGDYDWTHQGNAMYTIEIPASGGASINNATEGFGWFTGVCDGVLPWRGPVIGFRASGMNDSMIETGTSVASASDIVDEMETQMQADPTGFHVNVKELDGSAAGAEIAAAVHERNVEGTTSFEEAVRLIMARLFGKASGGGTATLVFRDIGDTKDRLTMTVDASGNRSAVTKDAS